MELPKNVTQIGEADRHCKIYVEDYCVSYLRQMNHQAEDKPVGIALYGNRREEGDTAYLFFYGACKLDFLVREVRHLSQAQNQEVEKLRKRYFPDLQFLGYLILNGEMVEGFHVCEQGICRYIKGYACFYEKNDAMLAYMLDSRGTEAEPEQVDEEKYEVVKQRQQNRKREYQSRTGRSGSGMVQEGPESRGAGETQENLRPQDVRDGAGKPEREEEGIPDIRRRETAGSVGQASAARNRWRANLRQGGWRKGAAQRAAEREGASSGQRSPDSGSLQLMRLSVAGVFLLLLVAGIATLNNHGGVENLQNAAKHLLAEMTEQKLPDSSEEVLAAMNPQATQETLYAGEDLTEALQKENQEPGEQTAGGQASEQPEETSSEGTLPSDGPAASDGEQTPASGSSASDGTQPSEDVPALAEGSAAPEGEQGSAEGSSVPDGEQMPEQGSSVQEGTQPSEQDAAVPEGTQEANAGEDAESPASEEAMSSSAPISYTIQKGDTLIGISRAHYGTEAKVPEICALNNITNPDDIYFGQKILLP